MVTTQDLIDLLCINDDDEDRVALLRNRMRRNRAPRPQRDERFLSLRTNVAYEDLKPALKQPRGHGATHVADADDADRIVHASLLRGGRNRSLYCAAASLPQPATDTS